MEGNQQGLNLRYTAASPRDIIQPLRCFQCKDGPFAFQAEFATSRGTPRLSNFQHSIGEQSLTYSQTRLCKLGRRLLLPSKPFSPSGFSSP